MALSFMKLVTKTGTLPKNAGGKKIDPLSSAKNKVLEALKVQKGYVQLVIEGKELPKNDAGRQASTWFCRQMDGMVDNRALRPDLHPHYGEG